MNDTRRQDCRIAAHLIRKEAREILSSWKIAARFTAALRNGNHRQVAAAANALACFCSIRAPWISNRAIVIANRFRC